MAQKLRYAVVGLFWKKAYLWGKGGVIGLYVPSLIKSRNPVQIYIIFTKSALNVRKSAVIFHYFSLLRLALFSNTLRIRSVTPFVRAR